MSVTEIAHKALRKAAWFEHYSPTHWSLNLVNVNPHLPCPYTISKVKGGYTVTLNQERIGRFAAFEDAIAGCWEHCDEDVGKALFGGGYAGTHEARRVA